MYTYTVRGIPAMLKVKVPSCVFGIRDSVVAEKERGLFIDSVARTSMTPSA
jgi:hypothetical protein